MMFGDYSYGTEVLRMPRMDDELTTDYPAGGLRPEPLTSPGMDASFDPSATYWFRWITGHQVMLVLWQILNRDLHARETFDAETLLLYTDILNACTLTFEYTASCSEAYYQKHIRPTMILAHRAFSGRWVADYVGLPKAVNRAAKNTLFPRAGQQMREAYLQSQKMHVRVAQKLVPEGASLLKCAKSDGIASVEEVKPHHQEIFDHFFLIGRGSVSASELHHSLRRRLAAIATDLEANPLADSSAMEHPKAILQAAADSTARLLKTQAEQSAALHDRHATSPSLPTDSAH